MPPFTIPYAPRRLYDYGPSRTLGELMRLRAEQQAQAIRQQGDISGQLWSNVGSQIGNTLGQLAQYKLDEPQRQFEAAKLAGVQREARDVQQAKEIQRLALKPNDQGVLTYDRDLLTREFTAAGIGDRLPGLLKSLDDADSAALGLKEAQAKFARQGLDALLNGVEAGGSTLQAVKAAAEYGVANGLFSRPQAQQVVARAEADPASIPQIVAALRGEKPKVAEPFTLTPGGVRFDPSGRQIASVPVTPPKPEGFTLGEGQVRYGPEGQVVARGPAKPPKELTVAEAQRTRLVDAVIANPALWDDLTPTVKGDIAADLNAKGFSGFGRRLTDAAIKQISETKSAIDSLRDLRVTLQENEQYIGPVAGLAALNPYSEAREAQAKIDLVRQRVGKALEGGVLRKEDEEKYRRILATLRDVPSTAIFKVDNLIATLERDLDNYIEEQRSAGRRVAQPPRPGAPTDTNAPLGSVTVTAPDGTTYIFPNQMQADAFKKRAGIR
jgi:hypothetical protein